MTESARFPSTAAHHHAVRFYENDTSLSQIVAQFLSEGIAAGNPGIVIAMPAQRAAIMRELVSRSSDIAELQRSDSLVFLDANETLSTFMRDGMPDVVEFQNSMCEVIGRACRGRPNCTIRVYGQMVDVLWKNGQQEAAIRLEMLWNQLANTHAFSLVCGYAMGHFYKDADVNEICGHHTHVLSADGEATAVA
jgi:hypothetical protein